MNLKSLSKISEKIIVIVISLQYIAVLIRLVSIFLDPNTSFSGFSRVRNMFDIMSSMLALFSVAALVLIVIGIIQVIKERHLGLNKYFRYPVYYFFLSLVFGYILDLMHAFSDERVSPFMREPIETPWYEDIISVLGYLFFIVMIFHFIVRKREPIKKPVEVHKLKRLFNWLLDNLHIVAFLLFYGRSLPYEYRSGSFEGAQVSLLLIIITFIYYFSSELLFGQTIGKLMDNSFIYYKGNRLKAIFLRTICRFIPFEPFSFLFAEKGWHDRLSNTSVLIEKKSYSEEEQETKVASEAELVEVRF